MKQSGREERAIRSIHTNLIYIVVAAVIIALIVLFNFSRQGLLGPIRDGGSGNPVVIWSVSDHSSTNQPLVNSLDGGDIPEYPGDLVLPLTRNADGSLKALPRYQGTLKYHAP